MCTIECDKVKLIWSSEVMFVALNNIKNWFIRNCIIELVEIMEKI